MALPLKNVHTLYVHPKIVDLPLHIPDCDLVIDLLVSKQHAMHACVDHSTWLTLYSSIATRMLTNIHQSVW